MIARQSDFGEAGGAQSLTDALARRLTARAGRIRTGARVTGIGTDRRQVRWVEVCGTERIATRVIVADVAAPALYGGLIPVEELPQRVRRGMRLFQLDPGTIKVDGHYRVECHGTIHPSRASTVHIADSSTLILANRRCSHHCQGPPADRQMTSRSDRSRPERAFWDDTQLTQTSAATRQDGLTGVWDADEKERMAIACKRD